MTMMSCRQIVTSLPFYNDFAAIRKADYQRMPYNIYIFIISNLLSYKT